MTQSNPLELAKQGDPQAIATLMNRTLQPKGMNATASLEGDRLEVVIESDQIPNQQVLTNFVPNGLKSLGLRSIQTVKIVGKQVHSEHPAWEQEIVLMPAPGAPPPGIIPPPPPPPPRPPLTTPTMPPPAAEDVPIPLPQAPHVVPPPIPPLKPEVRSPQPSFNGLEPPALEEPLPPVPPEILTPVSELPPDLADNLISAEEHSTPTTELPSDLADNFISTELPPALADNLITTPPDFYLDNTVSSSDLSAAPNQLGEDVEWQGDPVTDDVFDSPVGLTGMPEVDELEALAEQELGPVKPVLSVTPVPTPTPEPIPEPISEPEPSRLPIGGVVAAVLLVGLSFGIIAYSLYRALTGAEPDPVNTPLPTPTMNSSVAASPAPAATPVPNENAYQEALDLGVGASTMAQSAQSIDDWGLVAAKWQQAIALLQSVPANHPNYASAQQTLQDYQNNLASAQQRANQPIGNGLPPTSTTTVAGGIVCPEIAANAEAPAVELTSVRLEPSETTGADLIVGCVTNHSSQAIASISISYQPAGNPTTDPQASASPTEVPPTETSDLSFENLQPGRTVPFRSTATIPAEVTSLTIESITLAAAEGTEPQQIPSGLQISR